MFLLLISFAASFAQKPVVRPLNIAHRGSSGRLPEHTVEAYRQELHFSNYHCLIERGKNFDIKCNAETFMPCFASQNNNSHIERNIFKCNQYNYDRLTFDDKNVKMRERQRYLYHLCSCMKIGTEEKRIGLEIASLFFRKIKKKTKSSTNQLFPCNI